VSTTSNDDRQEIASFADRRVASKTNAFLALRAMTVNAALDTHAAAVDPPLTAPYSVYDVSPTISDRVETVF